MASTMSPEGLAYLASHERSALQAGGAFVAGAGVDYDEIIRLLTHRHTGALFKRQAASFRQIAREKQKGLAIGDLDPVCRVVQLGLERLPQLQEDGVATGVFLQPLCSLVRLFGLPLLTTKAYEELDSGDSLALVISVLLQALESDAPELIHAVAQTLMAFTGRRSRREHALRCDLVARSGIVEALVLCMQRNAADLATALPLVSACRHLATLRRVAPEFDARVFGVLVDLLEVREFRAPLVLEVVQLLWLLMDQSDGTEEERGPKGSTGTLAAAQKSALLKSAALLSSVSVAALRQNSAASIRAFASLRSVTVLTTLLRQAFASGYRNTDKQVRNDLVVLMVLLSRESGARKLLAEVGVLEELVQHATYTEIKLLQQAASGDKANLLGVSHASLPLGGGNGATAAAPSPTVGLGKIRALRSAGGHVNGPSAASFALSQDFFTLEEDMQLKLLAWHLASNCAPDLTCHAVLLRSAGGPSEPSDLMQVLLLYIDTAEAFNTHQLALAQQALQAGKTMQSAQALLANTAALEAAGPSPIAQTSSFAAATVLQSRLSFSQLTHLQSEALLTLSALVPRSYESFVALGGLGRLLAFVTAVLANPAGVEEKRLNASQALAMQGQALNVLLRAMQAGRAMGAPCPLTISSGGRGGSTTSFGSGAADSLAAPMSPTASQPNIALQELLDPAHDEALEAVLAAMAAGGGSGGANGRSGSTASLSTPVKSRGGFAATTSLVAGHDAGHVLVQLLSLFGDPSKPSATRADALSIVSLLVEGNPGMQRAFRQAKGVHLLAQFLSNDGAAVARGAGSLGSTGLLLSGARPAARPSPNGNLVAHAAKSPHLLVAAVDALWTGVVGVPKNEALFLALNGLDLVLDLLLLVAPAQRKQVLGFLSDLLANPAAHRYLHEWEAPPGSKLPGHDVLVGASVAPMTGATAGVARSDRNGAVSPLSSAPSSSEAGPLAGADAGFTALELLLSLWPSPSLLERSEKQVQGHLRYKASNEGAGTLDALASPLMLAGAPEGVLPEEDSDVEQDDEEQGHRDGWMDGAEEKEDGHGGSASVRQQRYEAHLASTSRAANMLPRVAANQHLKPALYAIFARLGFEGVAEDGDGAGDRGDEEADLRVSGMGVSPLIARATPVQRATLYEISRFIDVIRSSTLASIERRLGEEQVRIVPSDAAFLATNDAHLSELESRSREYEAAQWGAHIAQERAAIDAYLAQITTRKANNEQFLLANARRTKKQTMRRRLLYKEMRQQMLRNSATAGGGAEDGDAGGSAEPRISDATLSEHKSQLSLQQQAYTLQQEQNRDDEEFDIELENRLLADLDSSLPLDTGSMDLGAPLDGDDGDSETELEHKYASDGGAGSHTASRSKLIVSQLDPAAEDALMAARREQRQRQAAISAALQSAPSPAPVAPTSRTTTGSQPSSQRTTSTSRMRG